MYATETDVQGGGPGCSIVEINRIRSFRGFWNLKENAFFSVRFVRMAEVAFLDVWVHCNGCELVRGGTGCVKDKEILWKGGLKVFLFFLY